MTSSLLNNRYRILQVLGKGGFGETFLAEDTHMPSRRCCVVKRLKPVTNAPDIYQVIQERFQREAVILEDLGEGSDQIPQLYAYFAEQDQFYLVQEWIQGVTLRQKLEQSGKLSEPVVREILQGLLVVLEYAHQKGVIHRDIKPDNIILRQQDSQPVLIDFGIAKEVMATLLTDRGHVTHSIVGGTPGFMPPEQAIGKPVYASDLYSLGLTAIYLLTGKFPQEFPVDMTTGITLWHKSALEVSPDLVEVLDVATQAALSDRYPTARAMRDALNVTSQSGKSSWQPTIATPSPAAEPISTHIPQPATAKSINPAPPVVTISQAPLSREEYRNQQILLNKVKNYWVKGVLETSLHGKVWIELGLEERPDAVEHPWRVVWETPEQAGQMLPSSIRVVDKFDELGMGRTLLILGEPGSGKTTTLLELTRDLIHRAEQDPNQPIPVVFNLSSWAKPKLAIADWLVQELKIKYQVAAEIGQTWIQRQQLLLMLDGLDEVQAEHRSACVQAINQFSQAYGQTEMVVCSRTQDYAALSSQLRFQAAVYLQPLTSAQIQQYLVQAGPELAALRSALQTDVALQELVQSPLMLSIMTLAYTGIAPEDLPARSLEGHRQHLFDTYIERMLHRRTNYAPYAKGDVLRWLTWLAQRLQQESQTIFLIERMQPDWLETSFLKWSYALGVGLLGGLIVGIGGGTNVELIFRTGVGLLAGLISGLGGGLVAGLLLGVMMKPIEPVETLKWSWEKAKANWLMGARIGLTVGLVAGISTGLITGLVIGGSQFQIIREFMIYGSSGVGTGLVFVLLQGLTGPVIETSIKPNQSIHQSIKNAVAFTLIGVLTLGMTAHLMGVPAIFGAIVGLMFGCFSPAGLACLQHLILRLILYANGYTPWNYARFLNYATQLIFLQKVGGGYLFIHRLLLEHFAHQSSSASENLLSPNSPKSKI